MAIQFSSAQYRGLATLIEAGAKRHLADEYDGAQARGEVRSHTLVCYTNCLSWWSPMPRGPNAANIQKSFWSEISVGVVSEIAAKNNVSASFSVRVVAESGQN
jgi:hypothetical protein